MNTKFNPEHKRVLDKLLLDKPGIRPAKMFGYPAYFAHKKLCICLYEEGVGLKLPESAAKHLLETDDNNVSFQPMGKPKMREWIQINLPESDAYQNYAACFESSIQYLLDLQGVTR